MSGPAPRAACPAPGKSTNNARMFWLLRKLLIPAAAFAFGGRGAGLSAGPVAAEGAEPRLSVFFRRLRRGGGGGLFRLNLLKRRAAVAAPDLGEPDDGTALQRRRRL